MSDTALAAEPPGISTPLGQAAVKMQWASVSINSVASNIHGFVKELDFDILLEREGEDKSVLLMELKPFEMSPVIPLQIGDAVHSMRSSLDYLADEICKSNSPTKAGSRHIYFPFGEDKDNLIGRVRKMTDNQGLPVDIADLIINKIRPWRHPEGTGNTPLWSLNRLDQIDKHKLLVPTASVARLTGVNLDVRTETGGVILQNCRITLRPFPARNPGRKRYELRVAQLHDDTCELEIMTKGQPTYDVVFEGELFTNHSVIQTLHDLLDRTYDAYKAIFTHIYGIAPGFTFTRSPV